MTKRNLTIKDIAQLTKLSNGTVDRVLHNRGGVSQKSYNKVMKVIKDQGYEPNIHASMLAYHKSHTIAVVIPEYNKGDFWALYQPGLEKAIWPTSECLCTRAATSAAICLRKGRKSMTSL